MLWAPWRVAGAKSPNLNQVDNVITRGNQMVHDATLSSWEHLGEKSIPHCAGRYFLEQLLGFECIIGMHEEELGLGLLMMSMSQPVTRKTVDIKVIPTPRALY